MRRQQGTLLDALGFGPQPKPSRTVWTSRAARVLAYQAPNARQPAILMVPAPIKTSYIWDMASGASALERWLVAGMQAYLIAWQLPDDGDEWMGLDEYASRSILECLQAVAAETGHSKVFLAGHSLGGTLAAIFASLHPERVRALIELEGPMAFGTGQLEAALARAPPAGAITQALGNVPGTFLDWASAWADPLTFGVEPWIDWMASGRSAAAHRLHWQVRRWSLDESPIARKLFDEVADALYRENRFAERCLRIGGRLADPRAIEVPILAVLDPRSRIVPPASVEAYRTCTGSSDVEILEYRGDTGVLMQHVGVLIGENAHASLWPQILDWSRRH